MKERQQPNYALGDGTAYDERNFASLEDQKLYEANVYSRLEMEQLTKFNHIIGEAHKLEDQIADGQHLTYFWFPEGKPEKRAAVFDMNPLLLYRMRTIAWHMYTGHDIEVEGQQVHIAGFRDSEKMREAADLILGSYRKEKEIAEEFEKRELNNIWNTD